MYKEDLWCTKCGTQEFIERHGSGIHSDTHPEWYYCWECIHCHAGFEDNLGYGYFASWPGEDYEKKFSCGTGDLVDDSKLPRTPEGIVRHCGSKEELENYLERTQIK